MVLLVLFGQLGVNWAPVCECACSLYTFHNRRCGCSFWRCPTICL